ncbi:MAG: hypothetical protein Q8K75_07750 [Chlamydiales bacterium]|nr:hypothetical protein [Chlamydiales bacterium]
MPAFRLGDFNHRIRFDKPDKPQISSKQYDRDQLKVQLAAEKVKLSHMKTHAKVLKKTAFKKHKTPKSYISAKIAGKNHRIAVRKRAPIEQRMTAYVELQSLQKKISVKEQHISTIKTSLKGRVGKVLATAKEGVLGLVRETDKYGSEGRGASLIAGSLRMTPLILLSAVGDTVRLILSGVAVLKTGKQKINLKGIIAQGTLKRDELVRQAEGEINPKKKADLLHKVGEINVALEALRVEVKHVSLADTLQKTLSSGLKVVHSYAKVIQSLSVLLPLFVNVGRAAVPLSVAGNVAGLITLPFSLLLSVQGISSCCRNLHQARKDFMYAATIRDSHVNLAASRAESLAVLYDIPDLDREARQLIQEADSEILDLAPPRDPKEIVAIQSKLSEQMLHRIADCAENEEMLPFIAVRNRLELNAMSLTVVDNLEAIILPYVKQKVRMKAVQELLRFSAEGLIIAGSFIATGGAFTGNVPLMVAGAVTGLSSIAVQYPLSMLISFLGKKAIGKGRVSTEQFTDAFKANLLNEIQNWDALETAGLTETTSTSIIFNLLKPHYHHLPSNWGPREWAQSLASDVSNGVEWGRYEKAINNLRHHDSSRSVAEGVPRWIKGQFKRKAEGI